LTETERKRTWKALTRMNQKEINGGLVWGGGGMEGEKLLPGRMDRKKSTRYCEKPRSFIVGRAGGKGNRWYKNGWCHETPDEAPRKRMDVPTTSKKNLGVTKPRVSGRRGKKGARPKIRQGLQVEEKRGRPQGGTRIIKGKTKKKRTKALWEKRGVETPEKSNP